MVEALPVARRDAEHLVNGIIEVAADPGRTNARLFSFEVQHLAYETGLPEESEAESYPAEGAGSAAAPARLVHADTVPL